LRPGRLALSWLLSALALLFAAAVLPGVTITGFWGAVTVAAAVGVLNALAPPLVAALRLPATLVVGFLALLALDALIIEWAAHITDQAITVTGFGAALLTALLAAAVTVALGVVLGTDDDDEYSLRVTRRIARRQGAVQRTEVPGILFLEIDGLGLPILRRALRDGSAPNMARWLREGTHRLFEWETDLSSQTGASQAGILLGSNEDIPAFRWVEKEHARIMSCSSARDCAEIERRRAAGRGLLTAGGTSRGNLLSGGGSGADPHREPHRGRAKANPATGPSWPTAQRHPLPGAVCLGGGDRAAGGGPPAPPRRAPRGTAAGVPDLRAAMCVLLPELIVHAVLTDMMRGRSVLYATFSAATGGPPLRLERSDTLEALPSSTGSSVASSAPGATAPASTRSWCSRPRADPGATFQAAQRLRLDELVRRSIERPKVLGAGRWRPGFDDGRTGVRRGHRSLSEQCPARIEECSG
jgi:uncharacterized membrane protein YvlD (DUF360 family)